MLEKRAGWSSKHDLHELRLEIKAELLVIKWMLALIISEIERESGLKAEGSLLRSEAFRIPHVLETEAA